MDNARTRAQWVLDSIAANVRRLRTRAGLTQERLAEAADLELSFMQRVERGETNIGVVALTAIADALKVTPGVLMRRAKMPPIRMGRPKKKGPRSVR